MQLVTDTFEQHKCLTVVGEPAIKLLNQTLYAFNSFRDLSGSQVPGRNRVPSRQRHDALPRVVYRHAVRRQDRGGGRPVNPQQPQQHVLRSDVPVTQTVSLLDGPLESLLRLGTERYLDGRGDLFPKQRGPAFDLFADASGESCTVSSIRPTIPFPSRSRPRSTCSVSMDVAPSWLTSYRAKNNARRADSVNRWNMLIHEP